ncbi:MAG: response regulator [Elusimicrobiota bacterium]
MSKTAFTTHHISKICGVTMPTVINWIEQGQLPAYKTLGGHRRVKQDDLIEFLKKNKFPLPDELAKEWSCRILIVDDEKGMINLITRLIKKSRPDCILSSAMDGFEAGRQVVSFKPDIVILDLKLPGIDGFEVCRKLKFDPQTKHIKILAITEHHSEETKKKIPSYGADAYLSKPFDNKEFIMRLNNLGVSPEERRRISV